MLYSQALSAVQPYLAVFAAADDFEDLIVSIFGADIDRSVLAKTKQQLLAGDFLRRCDLLAVASAFQDYLASFVTKDSCESAIKKAFKSDIDYVQLGFLYLQAPSIIQ